MDIFKIRTIEKLLEKSIEIVEEKSSDPTFIIWKSSVERSLTQIFGADSLEVKEFNKLEFYF